ncbi:hypothetical protein E4U55_003183 [Claviceps digitariae]|nr:hypothetical protein E4U55_003183 [Claviceps digitariae]
MAMHVRGVPSGIIRPPVLALADHLPGTNGDRSQNGFIIEKMLLTSAMRNIMAAATHILGLGDALKFFFSSVYVLSAYSESGVSHTNGTMFLGSNIPFHLGRSW